MTVSTVKGLPVSTTLPRGITEDKGSDAQWNENSR
ncbi:hypothetical protein [Escherichia coli]|nr:hypothetical protein [Escherichia coli]